MALVSLNLVNKHGQESTFNESDQIKIALKLTKSSQIYEVNPREQILDRLIKNTLLTIIMNQIE